MAQAKFEENRHSMLVLGCGHAGCRYVHPKSYTWTIDICKSMKPDSTQDIRQGIPEELIGKKFDAVILECLPHDIREIAISHFQSLLKEKGVILIKGFWISEINLLQEYKVMSFDEGRTLVLHHHNSEEELISQLWRNEPIKKYLLSCGVKKYSSPTVIDLKEDKSYCYLSKDIFNAFRIPSRMEWMLWIEMLSDFSTKNSSFSGFVKSIIQLNKKIEANNQVPLTYRTLHELLYDDGGYNPGWFRSNITGETEAIKKLKELYESRKGQGLDTPLNEKDRDKLVELIFDRNSRMMGGLTSLNFTRSANGETTRILQLLLMHLLTTEEQLIKIIKCDNKWTPVPKVGLPTVL